jgi:hypothetical protein
VTFPDAKSIEQAVEKAQDAFWAEVARAFPEVTTGDFGPGETFAIQQAMEDAVSAWLAWNHPQSTWLTGDEDEEAIEDHNTNGTTITDCVACQAGEPMIHAYEKEEQA